LKNVNKNKHFLLKNAKNMEEFVQRTWMPQLPAKVNRDNKSNYRTERVVKYEIELAPPLMVPDLVHT
jgi:hypothetical protein